MGESQAHIPARDTGPDSAQDSTRDGELFLVDGSGFIFRAYYAMAYSGRTMTSPQGVPVGAVYGFTNMLLKMLRDYHAPYMAVIFDAARRNFRNDIYPEYKANRDETPEDLIPQFPLIREATQAFDIPALQLEGYEADDLIAAYTKLARAQGKKVVIVSSDKDLMQLIQPGVRMLDPMKNVFVGPDEVREKFGVGPERVVDVQALAGDSTDNVPGVPGIGLKTAAQLINEYGDLDTLLARAGEIKQPKRREVLLANAENARISRKLVMLDADAPVPVPLAELKTHDPDKAALIPFLQTQGFESIIKRLGSNGGGNTSNKGPLSLDPSPPEGGEGKERSDRERGSLPSPVLAAPIADNIYVLINDAATLRQWMDEARGAGVLCVDTETTGLTPAKAGLVGVALCIRPGRAAYVPLGHVQETDLLGSGTPPVAQMNAAEALDILRPVLEDDAVLKIGHNIKYDWQMFRKAGIAVAPCNDTMLMSYVLDGSAHSHGMDNLSQLWLAHTPISYDSVTGTGKNRIGFARVAIDQALPYAAEDADVTLRLHGILAPRLPREAMAAVYEDIERPLIPVIAQMELDGIRVDPKVLQGLSHDFGTRLVQIESEIHALAGHEFNIASPKQVAAVLFDEMGLEGGRKTKGGTASTSVDVLEKLAAEGHAIVQKILDYRQLAKLKSTYSDALLAEINPATGRVHTSFAMAHTNTGRLSSSEPNLQNIPIRTEEGRRIRAAFVAQPGHKLISVDYSQVELRLAAALANVEALKRAFRDNRDIHAITASEVFGVPLDQVTSEIRRQAKAVNFGIIYGISGWGLAKQLGCSAEDANAFIRKYFARFPELQAYMQARKDEAREHGFVKTFHGRKCVIGGITDKNPAVRGFAERQAINAPLQGTAADIMKIAMARMPNALTKAGLTARLLLQVHDELVFEAPDAEAQQTAALAVEVMQGAADVGVVLAAEARIGASWAAAH